MEEADVLMKQIKLFRDFFSDRFSLLTEVIENTYVKAIIINQETKNIVSTGHCPITDSLLDAEDGAISRALFFLGVIIEDGGDAFLIDDGEEKNAPETKEVEPDKPIAEIDVDNFLQSAEIAIAGKNTMSELLRLHAEVVCCLEDIGGGQAELLAQINELFDERFKIVKQLNEASVKTKE